MTDYDDLLDEVLTEPEGIRSDLARGAAKDQAAPKRPPRTRESSGSVSTFKPDPKPAKKQKGAARSGPKNAASVKPDARKQAQKGDKSRSAGSASPDLGAPQLARRGMARLLERSGRCPMYAPRGTVCKSCGKVHPQ